MANELTKQELHNLAMNVVGEDLEKNGYEFLGVNSSIKANPQFVALKNKKLHFVVVRAIQYPKNPKVMDRIYMETMKDHASKFEARAFYAGVGIANAKDYELPVTHDDNYIINYDGWQEV
ncbi:Na(+)-translocating NADH-quinone reductase subunit F [Zunongwangia sp. HGR-M22]|uniref:Na(+)-translocating NADH-quinone reductase subunit F n=1 Tax=Zunongwangia sp. HGR-M22 TaxID=3015168 RepID=UPI0022DDB67C|nr:Na(+)-translocating NADH-quinone reductase subunit F [Zunongwangia sp. HGR-M22]WBL26533.1 Na(+)-translocating NADH-quinone reductase subunit F [Zunongwangia sp. HGR-M22]